MKFVDEFRDAAAAQTLLRRIRTSVTKPWTIMEVCGGQTHTIVRYGIDELLPSEITLVHGPGCPVCVTPIEMVDLAIEIAKRPEVILCSFGDMLRVPGSSSDLFDARATGADVRIVYSPLDALALARREPSREIVFFAVGFETTAPMTAGAVNQASLLGVKNFSVISAHVRVPPAITAILSSPDNRIQGFLRPATHARLWGWRNIVDSPSNLECRSSLRALSQSTFYRVSRCAWGNWRRVGPRSRISMSDRFAMTVIQQLGRYSRKFLRSSIDGGASSIRFPTVRFS